MKLSLPTLILTLLTPNVFAAPPKHHELTSSYSFETFVSDFKKAYEPDSDEWKTRQRIFESNLNDILAHNARSHSYKKGVNKFTDMKDEEVAKGFDKGGHWKYGSGGGSKTERRVEETDLPFTIDDVSSLPKEVDWRHESIVTAVKDQGHCGSCWAFATSALLESHIAKETGILFNLSPQQLLSCIPKPHHCDGSGGSGGGVTCHGSTIKMALDYVKANGIVEEYQRGYTSYYGVNEICLDGNATAASLLRGSSTGPDPAGKSKPVAGIESYRNLPVNDYQYIMNAVAKHGPVGVSVAASPWHAYESGVFSFDDIIDDEKPTRYNLNHAVVLVGYGTDEETGMDYWLVRNSWSPTWGEKGYIRLKRGEGECGMDVTPADGSACTIDEEGKQIDDLPAIEVCGTSGVLFGGVIAVGGYLN